jgi:hypothetical protein
LGTLGSQLGTVGSHQWGVTQKTQTPMTDEATNQAPGSADISVEPYIDKREVARRLGRSIRTVNNLMRLGRIPYYKFDSRISFRWSEIEARLAQPCHVSGEGAGR